MFNSVFLFCVNNQSSLREHQKLSKEHQVTVIYWAAISIFLQLRRANCSAGLKKQKCFCWASGSLWSASAFCLHEKASFLLARVSPAPFWHIFLEGWLAWIQHWLTSSHSLPCILTVPGMYGQIWLLTGFNHKETGTTLWSCLVTFQPP